MVKRGKVSSDEKNKNAPADGRTASDPLSDRWDRPGFYVARCSIYDRLEGRDRIYKVGCTGRLDRRLADGEYTTTWPPGAWSYAAVVSATTSEAARDLESVVLALLDARRIAGVVGEGAIVRRELVSASLTEILSAAAAGVAALDPSRSVYSPAVLDPKIDVGPREFAKSREREKEDRRTAAAEPKILNAAREKFELAPTPIPLNPSPAPTPIPPKPKPALSQYEELYDEAEELEKLAESAESAITIATPAEFRLREYQAEAVAGCAAELEATGRAVLQVACRCGKTLIAQRLALAELMKEEAPDGAPPIVVYLVPGLALLRQTALKFDAYGTKCLTLLIGSDPRPLPEFRTLEPVGPQTTDSDFISHTLATSNQPLIIFSTYQSSPLLGPAFTEANIVPSLIISDEAHRVCGPDVDRPFTFALKSLQAERRLFMTATPRKESNIGISMANRELFGGVAYAYHMRRGIDAGYVNPFALRLVGGPTMAARVVAAAGQVNKLLVFCKDIAHATDLCAEVKQLLPPALCLSAHSKMPPRDQSAALRAFMAPGVPAILFNCRLFQEGVEIPWLTGVFFASPRHSPRDIVQSLSRPGNIMPGKPTSQIFIPVEGTGEKLAAGLKRMAEGDSEAGVAVLKKFATVVPYFDALIDEDPLLYEHVLDPKGVGYDIGWVESNMDLIEAESTDEPSASEPAASTAGESQSAESQPEVIAAAPKYRPADLLAAARRVVRWGAKGSGRSSRLLRADRIPWEIGFAELQRIVTDFRRYPKGTDGFEYGLDPDTGKPLKVNFSNFYKFCRENYAAQVVRGETGPLEPFQLRALETLPAWGTYGVDGPYRFEESLEFLDWWLTEHDGVPPPLEINKGGFVGLTATPLERLSGVLTCINQGDGRDRKGKPGTGFTVSDEKAAKLDELCGRFNLRWRKERGPDGALRVNRKNQYIGEPTFIQQAFAEFKRLWFSARDKAGILKGKPGTQEQYALARSMVPLIEQYFPDYPTKHAVQEYLDVDLKQRPPRWRHLRDKK